MREIYSQRCVDDVLIGCLEMRLTCANEEVLRLPS
jgi:hypothetical protein